MFEKRQYIVHQEQRNVEKLLRPIQKAKKNGTYLALDVRHDAALRAPSLEGFLLPLQCGVRIG